MIRESIALTRRNMVPDADVGNVLSHFRVRSLDLFCMSRKAFNREDGMWILGDGDSDSIIMTDWRLAFVCGLDREPRTERKARR